MKHESQYLELIETSIPYTSEEERRVFNRYAKTSDPKLKKEIKKDIISHNYKLIASVARQYVNPENPMSGFDDLFQEGVIGVGRAVDGFDVKRGNKFSTYAIFWIKQKILRYLSTASRTIKRPVHLIQKKYQIKKLQKEREIEGKDPLTWEEIKEIFNLSDIHAYKADNDGIFETVSLDIKTSEDDSETSFLLDFIVDPESDNVYEAVEKEMLKKDLEKMLEAYLDKYCSGKTRERNKKIIQMRTGIGTNGRIYTLEEIGNQYGITRERTRQIENKFMRYLMKPKNKAKLKGYR